MKRNFLLLCVLCILTGNVFSKNFDRQPNKQKDFIIGTHYYGLTEYSWPINYLNAVRADDIYIELKEIKDIGFNTIILLASWSEFEPVVGRADEDAYKKINSIISIARSLEIDVIIRIPYLWSLEGNEVRERLAYALLGAKGYRNKLLKFLYEFDRKVVQQNSNIIMNFGSWEDFYVLRDFFFYGESVVSELVRQTFNRDTGIDANSVQMNGVNYDRFNIWLDSMILQLTKEIGRYGYEIRTDADLFVKNGKQQWHSHSGFFKNQSEGKVVAYWAPYFGQINNGESINSDQAIKSFTWMLDSIAEKTSQMPFIDQLNFFDNSPGTEKNAKIAFKEYKSFFEKLSSVVTERTTGYALWTIRDYSHNILFNPAFSEGLKGWESDKAILTNSGLLINKGGILSQLIRSERTRVLKSSKPLLVVNILSGSAEVEVEKVGKFNIIGPGRHEIRIDAIPQSDFRISLKPIMLQGTKLQIQWISLYGHTQHGKVFDSFGRTSEFFKLVSSFNRMVAEKARQPCRGFDNITTSNQYLVRGIFQDGWTSTQVEICQRERNHANGFRLVYVNPLSKSREIKVTLKGIKNASVSLVSGEGSLHLCPPHGSKLDQFSLSISPAFIPAIDDKHSQDIRNLGILIKNMESFECQGMEGAW